MYRCANLLAFLAILCISPIVTAGPPAASAVPALGDNALHALSGSLRGFLVQNLPTTLFEEQRDWGGQKEVINGLKWKGQGLKVHPKLQKTHKNHGVWRKYHVSALNLPDSLILDLRNYQQAPHGPASFDLFLSFDAQMVYDQQNWRSGIRLYSGSTRARFRVKVTLSCEVSSKLEKSAGSPVPDVLFRMRVVRAALRYDNLVFEHVAGVGGEAAHAKAAG
jgi:hypothetical protein